MGDMVTEEPIKSVPPSPDHPSATYWVQYTISCIIIIIIIIIIQSALQPLWVLACSTIVEYSQQKGL